MQRKNNTYGELINNKFSELITTNSAKTWHGMKDLLDKEMPEDRRRKWLNWFTNKASNILVVLFSLMAAASGAW
jgi:hypothetical protein